MPGQRIQYPPTTRHLVAAALPLNPLRGFGGVGKMHCSGPFSASHCWPLPPTFEEANTPTPPSSLPRWPSVLSLLIPHPIATCVAVVQGFAATQSIVAMVGTLGLVRRRGGWYMAAAALTTLYFLLHWASNNVLSSTWSSHPAAAVSPALWQIPDDYFWRSVPTHFTPASVRPLPTARPTVRYPRVQASTFPSMNPARRERREAIKTTMSKSWNAYKAKAWLSDELMPVTGDRRNPFGGWGATLVDALDTLWIMGMREEFDEAVAAAATIDFTKTNLDKVNVFETTIRYLGGFLAAYDLSGDARLLRKAVEVGEMLYKAFDTPNRMPITRWNFHAAADGEPQVADDTVLLAEIGSMSMEFTRLSLLTGNPKWFDAVQGITDLMAAQQNKTALAGLWPMVVDAKNAVFHQGTHFTLGAMADSTFEYLPKMAALLGGKLPEYQTMYEKAADTAAQYLLFRPLTPTNRDIFVSGTAFTTTQDHKTYVTQKFQGQHLACFTGGMYALGGKLFNRREDLAIAKRLTEGCIWAYKASKHGVMPETFTTVACTSSSCQWDELDWKKQVVLDAGEKITGHFDADMAKASDIITEKRLPKGFASIPDARYILRPEAIESVFVLYRVTGRKDLLDAAWHMFMSIDRMTSTTLANSAVNDVTTPGKPSASDSMESFWLGETLKYFYLIFADEKLVSLDEWVFNTEAHPFRRITR